jgi:hypothetical protein
MSHRFNVEAFNRCANSQDRWEKVASDLYGGMNKEAGLGSTIAAGIKGVRGAIGSRLKPIFGTTTTSVTKARNAAEAAKVRAAWPENMRNPGAVSTSAAPTWASATKPILGRLGQFVGRATSNGNARSLSSRLANNRWATPTAGTLRGDAAYAASALLKRMGSVDTAVRLRRYGRAHAKLQNMPAPQTVNDLVRVGGLQRDASAANQLGRFYKENPLSAHTLVTAPAGAAGGMSLYGGGRMLFGGGNSPGSSDGYITDGDSGYPNYGAYSGITGSPGARGGGDPGMVFAPNDYLGGTRVFDDEFTRDEIGNPKDRSWLPFTNGAIPGTPAESKLRSRAQEIAQMPANEVAKLQGEDLDLHRLLFPEQYQRGLQSQRQQQRMLMDASVDGYRQGSGGLRGTLPGMFN